jgi:hypothetical protein
MHALAFSSHDHGPAIGDVQVRPDVRVVVIGLVSGAGEPAIGFVAMRARAGRKFGNESKREAQLSMNLVSARRRGCSFAGVDARR